MIDMLSVLIHGTLISEGQEKLEDNKKVYHNLIKKLKVGRQTGKSQKLKV